MRPIVKGVLATLLLSGGGVIWFSYIGYWTLIGLFLMWAGGWMVGELAAEAERP